MLTDRDRQILAFEAKYRKHSAVKEERIRDAFGVSAARYVQMLGVVIDNPDALRDDPQLVYALRSARAARAKQRSSRRFASVTYSSF